jgi:hypothetical protein
VLRPQHLGFALEVLLLARGGHVEAGLYVILSKGAAASPDVREIVKPVLPVQPKCREKATERVSLFAPQTEVGSLGSTLWHLRLMLI